MIIIISSRLDFTDFWFICASSQASALDALLDDSVMFAKKLRDMGQPVSLTVVEDLPHGFLSLSQLAKETEVAAKICVARMKQVFEEEHPTSSLHKRPKLEETYPSTNPSGWFIWMKKRSYIVWRGRCNKFKKRKQVKVLLWVQQNLWNYRKLRDIAL